MIMAYSLILAITVLQLIPGIWANKMLTIPGKQRYFSHPFETNRVLREENHSPAPPSSSPTPTPTPTPMPTPMPPYNLSLSMPLRIQPYFDDFNSTNLTALQYSYLLNQLMPAAVQFWKSALRVIPVIGNLYAERQCTLHQNSSVPVCKTIQVNQTCEDFVIPPQHFRSKRYCTDCAMNTDCSSGVCNMTNMGAGIPNADYVLYVQAKNAPKCLKGVVAYANACQRDQYDRPTFGAINFCPASLNETMHKSQFDIVIRETSRALGFTSLLFPYMRHTDGTPRTARHNKTNEPLLHYNVTCPNNVIQPVYALPNTSTVQVFFERGHRVAKLVTPKVLAFVRHHFGCQTLNGAELESDDDTCIGSHWEKRIFESEIMSPKLSHRTVFSALTLAFFEDSGWYVANYSMAQPLFWGAKRGCSFATEHCIKDKGNTSLDVEHFCTGKDIKTACSVDATSIATCSLREYPANSIPTYYQYYMNTKLGGGRLNDYCPILQGSSLGDCTVPSNLKHRLNSGFNMLGESYCKNCKCAISTLRHSSAIGLGGIKNRHSGCYRMTCDDGVISIGVTVSSNQGRVLKCDQKGKELVVAGFTGKIFCPDPTVVCHNSLNKCTVPCGKNSLCHSNGKCKCLSGYISDAKYGGCKSACPNACSYKGYCYVKTKKCSCNEGWEGADCSVRTQLNGYISHQQSSSSNTLSKALLIYTLSFSLTILSIIFV